MLMEQKLLELVARLTRNAERNKVYAMRAGKDGQPALGQVLVPASRRRQRLEGGQGHGQGAGDGD